MTSPVVRFAVFEADRAPDDRWTALAEPYEVARVAALRRPSDRLAYISAHLLLREVAAEALGLSASALTLRQQCPGCGASGHGRPAIRHHEGLALSLSHAVQQRPGARDRLAIAAIACWSATPVGIDVEFRGARVPERVLTPAERVAVAGGVDPVQVWTRKEACVKAGLATLDTAGEVDVLTPADPAWSFTDWSGPDAPPDVAGSWVRLRA